MKIKTRSKFVCFILIIATFLSLTFSGCNSLTKAEVKVVNGQDSYSETGISIKNEGNYFNVVLDYTSGLSRREMGRAYARGILKMVPDYEELVDSYLSESHNSIEYRFSLYNVDGLKTQIDKDYEEEYEGMCDVLSKDVKDIREDNKISKEEFYLFNLMADTIGTQCSFCSVYNERSEDGNTLLGRNLDWFGGSKNQISQFQAIITYKYKKRQVCSIGYMGFLGVITGINDKNNFAAILTSATGEAYDGQGKYSYPNDLRKALETCNSIDEIAAYMSDKKRYYSVNHIIALADESKAEVLENNFSGLGPNDSRVKRAVRTENSELNKGVEWGIPNAVGTVNSFVLKGNYDNHTHESSNSDRWETIKRGILNCGAKVDKGEMEKVMSESGNAVGPATTSKYLYNRTTTQSMVYEPKTRELNIYFRPKESEANKLNPQYKKVDIFKED